MAIVAEKVNPERNHQVLTISCQWPPLAVASHQGAEGRRSRRGTTQALDTFIKFIPETQSHSLADGAPFSGWIRGVNSQALYNLRAGLPSMPSVSVEDLVRTANKRQLLEQGHSKGRRQNH